MFPSELAFPQEEHLAGYEETLHEVLQPAFLKQLETIQQIFQPTDPPHLLVVLRRDIPCCKSSIRLSIKALDPSQAKQLLVF